MTLQAHDPLLQLSEFAYLRRVGEAWVLQSAHTSATLRLNNSTLQLLSAFLRPATPSQVLAAVAEDVRAGVSRWIELCHQHQLLHPVAADASIRCADTSLAHWQFHDLVFHTGSRAGRNRDPIGATYRLQGLIPEESPTHPRFTRSPGTPLAVHKRSSSASPEQSLPAALDTRTSRYGINRLTLQTLGQFLDLSCRSTTRSNADSAHRPYPSGGARYPLEVYFVAAKCDGIAPGLYQYNPHQHQIALVRPADELTQQLLSEAATCTGIPDFIPPILFVFAARFRRTAWKYESIAYHLILLELGALMQTMYLVAEALGLAACALGSGNADLFSQAADTDYYLESSVGEMTLGAQ